MAISTRAKIHRMPIVKNQQAVIARWIVGKDAFTTQEYLLHTDYPTFLAKISQSETEGVLASLSYGTRDGRNFYDFVWFDPYPDERQFLSLMREAEDALQTHVFL